MSVRRQGGALLDLEEYLGLTLFSPTCRRRKTKPLPDGSVSRGEDVPEWARRDSNARPLAPEASALSN